VIENNPKEGTCMGFWNKVGNAVVTVIEIVPEILGALQQEGAKKADSRVKDYESQVNQAANSSKMNTLNMLKKYKQKGKRLCMLEVK